MEKTGSDGELGRGVGGWSGRSAVTPGAEAQPTRVRSTRARSTRVRSTGFQPTRAQPAGRSDRERWGDGVQRPTGIRASRPCRPGFRRALRRLAGAAVLQGVEQDGDDDDGAHEDRLPVGGDADQHQPVGEEADHEGAQQGAAHRAATARERRAADHHAGDGGELVGVPGGGARAGQGRGEDDAGDGRAQARDHIDPDRSRSARARRTAAPPARCHRSRTASGRRSCRPSTTAMTRAITAMMSTPAGMPRIRLKPSHSKPVLPSAASPERSLIVRPLVISSAKPRTT